MPAFNQEKVLVGAFSVIVKTDCETDGLYAALLLAVVFGLVLIYTVAVYHLAALAGLVTSKIFNFIIISLVTSGTFA